MSPARAILLGGLIVGILDIVDPILFAWFRSGVRPMRILQSIAAGAIGRDAAYAGGRETAAIGLAFHFLIAFIVVTVFVIAARRLRWLVSPHPLVVGALYGLAVYAVMNYLVIPLSALGTGLTWPPTLPPGPVLANGLLIHIFGVGIPAALAGRAAAVKIQD